MNHQPLTWTCMLCACIGLPACVESTPTEAPADARTIGALLSFTGERASDAEAAEQALLMAAEAVNAAGGVGGRQIFIDARDTRSNTQAAIVHASDLFERLGAVAVIGPDDSETVAQLRETLSVHHAIEVTTTVTAAIDPAGDTVVRQFQVVPSLATFATALAAEVGEMAPGRSLSVLYADDGYGARLAESIRCALEADGTAVPTLIPIPADATELDQAAQRAADVDSDVGIVVGYALSSASLIQSCETLGWEPQWFLGPSLRDEQLLANVAPLVLESAAGVAPSVSPDFDRFAMLFNARWHASAPPTSAAYYYDALALIALATEATLVQTGNPNPTGEDVGPRMRIVASPPGEIVNWDELPRALELVRNGVDIDYVGVSGAVNLDERGMPPSGIVDGFRVANDHFEDTGSALFQPRAECR